MRLFRTLSPGPGSARYNAVPSSEVFFLPSTSERRGRRGVSPPVTQCAPQ
jgi:hypothetical protein